MGHGAAGYYFGRPKSVRWRSFFRAILKGITPADIGSKVEGQAYGFTIVQIDGRKIGRVSHGYFRTSRGMQLSLAEVDSVSDFAVSTRTKATRTASR